jgi:tetratricopeptide (TPR) repeat protein
MADSDQPRGRKRLRPEVPRTLDAVDIALERSDDETARTLLGKHTELLEAQIASERLDHSSKRMANAARFLLAFIALAIAGGLVWMVLKARADRGLVVESFSTPPDLAAKGMTGEVLAANLADRLGEIDRAANSFRSPETMSVNWGDDIRIEIPSTGVSIGELDRYLHRKLGHQTVVGGSVFRTPEGLRMTVRAGSLGTVEQVGRDPSLEAMVRKAAEGVFERTQPYRYSKYLEFNGRTDEAMAVARRVASTNDDPRERAWAWAQISNLLGRSGDELAASEAGKRAIAEDPNNALAYLNTSLALVILSHQRESTIYNEKAAEIGSKPEGGLSDVGINTSLGNLTNRPSRLGDYQEALRSLDRVRGRLYPGVREYRQGVRASILLAIHDISGSHAVAGALPDSYFIAHFGANGGAQTPQYLEALQLGDWPAAVRETDEMLATLAGAPEGEKLAELARQRVVLPLRATALALDGRLDEARAIAATLPLDCYNCAMARMQVAALGRDYPAAFSWFAQADRWGGDRPATATRLGQILEHQGQHAAALRLANQALRIGPKYPDALKLRGDALRKLNRLDDAIGAYAKAAEGAPRWGRLQIDWGFAEMRGGNWKKARAHLAAAQGMDLSPADRRWQAELKRVAGG